MPLVRVPKPKFIEKLKRFFLVDLLKGLQLTLKYNVGDTSRRLRTVVSIRPGAGFPSSMYNVPPFARTALKLLFPPNV